MDVCVFGGGSDERKGKKYQVLYFISSAIVKLVLFCNIMLFNSVC
jgi:hypothetical protein